MGLFGFDINDEVHDTNHTQYIYHKCPVSGIEWRSDVDVEADTVRTLMFANG